MSTSSGRRRTCRRASLAAQSRPTTLPRVELSDFTGFSGLHAYVGLAIILLWGVVAGWALVLGFSGTDETPAFWRAVSIAQILLAIQLLFGLGLFIGRGFAAIGAQGWFSTVFHPLYGFVFPFVVLFIAHNEARKEERNPHRVFALAAFVIFALAARGFMVGAGMG